MRINLLPMDERPPKQSAVRWEFVVTVLGLVILIATSVHGYLQTLRVQALQQEYNNLLGYKTLLVAQQNYIMQMQNQTQELNTQISYYQQLIQGANSILRPQDLPQVIACAPSNLWIEKAKFQGTVMLISGYTAEFPSLSTYLQNLQQQGFNAAINNLDELTVGTKLYSFTIHVQRGE